MSSSPDDLGFVFPPGCQVGGGFGNHLGLAYLRAALQRSGIGSFLYLNPRPGTIREVARELLSRNPKVVGFTAYDTNFALCLALTRQIKQLRPDVKTVVGGPTITFGWKELLSRHPSIDLCVLGEAEETGPSIFEKLLAGVLPDESQPGVAFRRNGQFVSSETAPLVGSSAPVDGALDVTPSPYLNGMLQDGRTGLLTGRGCTHHCQYCCFAALARRSLRLHAVDRVVAELECIAAHQEQTGQRYVVPIHDDTFTLFPERAKKLCERICNRGFHLSLSCVTRGDSVDIELLTVLRAAGFVNIAFGLESAVPSVLRATGKVRPPDWPDADLTPEHHFLAKFREGVTCAKRLGFTVGVSIILGLPTETPADGQATVDFIKTLPVDYYVHNLLSLQPGTPLWDRQGNYGLRCSFDLIGLPGATRHSYDVTRIAPAANSHFEKWAESIRASAEDAVHGGDISLATKESVHTVVVHAKEMSSSLARWLCEVLAVGGTVVHCYPPMSERRYNHALGRDRLVLKYHLVPARYYIQLQTEQLSSEARSYLVHCPTLDAYTVHNPDRLRFTSIDSPEPMLQWMQDIYSGCDICDVTPSFLRSSEFADFTSRINEEGGSSLRKMLIPPQIKYPGRWIKRGCSCSCLNRLEVDDDDGVVRACRCCPSIGTVGDPKEVLQERFDALAEAVEQRRGCDSCADGECPRCPFPGLDDRVYCETMKQCASALKAMDWIHIYSKLISLSSNG